MPEVTTPDGTTEAKKIKKPAYTAEQLERFIKTEIGLPSTCAATGQPVTGQWYAKSIHDAQCGAGYSEEGFTQLIAETKAYAEQTAQADSAEEKPALPEVADLLAGTFAETGADNSPKPSSPSEPATAAVAVEKPTPSESKPGEAQQVKSEAQTDSQTETHARRR